MPRTHELSSRERVRLALEHKETDRVPIAMVCSGINEPARSQFDGYLKREHDTCLQAYLDTFLDISPIDPEYAGPGLPPGQDIWGVIRTQVAAGGGTYDWISHHPLAEAKGTGEIAKYPFPTADIFDYSVLPDRIKVMQQDGERCLMISNANIFETSWYMRGFEQILLDMIMNPELVHAIMRPVTDFYVEYFTKTLSSTKGMIDLAFTADDIGGQSGLLMSLDMWEQFIKPYHLKVNKVIHEFGARVIYHTDGAVMKVVPGLIDMGIDVLQALQFDAAGMDPGELKATYGDRLCFEGGVSVQRTLPFGTVEEVRQEVRRLISVLGKDGGYILGPSHFIQAGTPPENILAMFETALHYYPFY
jgi:uroporphyrinogen decarboxylase